MPKLIEVPAAEAFAEEPKAFTFVGVPKILSAGDSLLALDPETFKETVVLCVWAGIWFADNETEAEPPASPSEIGLRPGPFPTPMGTRPTKFGKPKVEVPFPP